MNKGDGMMADYKSMYYYMAGRTATTIDLLEATTKILEGSNKSIKALEGTTEALRVTAKALYGTTSAIEGTIDAIEATATALEVSLDATTCAIIDIKDKLKIAQQATEAMFESGDETEVI